MSVYNSFRWTKERMLFDIVFSSRGGVLKFPVELLAEENTLFEYNILNQLDDNINFICSVHGIEDKSKIYLDIINDYSIGAAVKKYEDIYYIGINVGTIHILYNFFNRVMSSPEILTKYGDISLETQDYKLFNPNTFKIDQLLNQDAFNAVQPIDKNRKFIADSLLFFALCMIVNHEMAHILNGHVDYLASEDILSWNEDEENKEYKVDVNTIQTLEFDADAFSWNYVINLIHGILQGNVAILEDIALLSKDFVGLVKLVVFAMYSTLRLFGDAIPDYDKLLFKKSAHPKLRRCFLMGTVNSLLEYKVNKGTISGFTAYKFRQAIFDSAKDVEYAFSILTLDSNMLSKDELYKLISFDNTFDYLDSFTKNWIAVRKLLLPYAMIELVKANGPII